MRRSGKELKGQLSLPAEVTMTRPVNEKSSMEVARLACVLAVIAFLTAEVFGQDRVEPLVSLCDLAAHGESSDGHQVRLKAYYLTDLFHGAALKDKSCPKLELAPFLSTEPMPDPSLKAFDDALRSTNSAHVIQFLVDVEGRFVWRKDKQPCGALFITSVATFERIKGEWRATPHTN